MMSNKEAAAKNKLDINVVLSQGGFVQSPTDDIASLEAMLEDQCLAVELDEGPHLRHVLDIVMRIARNAAETQ
jgi:hypothetical protein